MFYLYGFFPGPCFVEICCVKTENAMMKHLLAVFLFMYSSWLFADVGAGASVTDAVLGDWTTPENKPKVKIYQSSFLL